MNVLLISTYDLGHQPFGLASPAAWLEREGMTVECLDLSREPLREAVVKQADFIAFHLPMHTATRLAVKILPSVRRLNPSAHLCFYGLYAPLNAEYLISLGAGTILGGEYEEDLTRAAVRARDASPAATVEPPMARISHARLQFIPPRRHGLPALARYARLRLPSEESRVAGYTEASRGCKHLCRHCPVVPVYQGRFRIVPVEVVLEDVRRQVAAGARHITFGDPDFLNGPRHALAVVNEFHRQFPGLTYDATIKIEHLLQHSNLLSMLHETGCLLITTAAESVDDAILARLAKGHTLAGFRRAVDVCRQANLALSPTFIAFTPWTTVEGYAGMLDAIGSLDLVDHVAPVQLGIRLLIPSGSRLLELDEVKRLVLPFDEERLIYPWRGDPAMEDLWLRVQNVIREASGKGESRRNVFNQLLALAGRAPVTDDAGSQTAIPSMSEPWYCCAEPSGDDMLRAAEPQI